MLFIWHDFKKSDLEKIFDLRPKNNPFPLFWDDKIFIQNGLFYIYMFIEPYLHAKIRLKY